MSSEKKINSEKKLDNQEKKSLNQEKKTFRITDKSYIDRDSEYLLQENEPNGGLDQQLLEDLQKKKSDPRYIEMQVMRSKWWEVSHSSPCLGRSGLMVKG